MLGRNIENTVKSFVVVYRKIDHIIKEISNLYEEKLEISISEWGIEGSNIIIRIFDKGDCPQTERWRDIKISLRLIFLTNSVEETYKEIKRENEEMREISVRRFKEEEKLRLERSKEEDLATAKKLIEKHGLKFEY